MQPDDRRWRSVCKGACFLAAFSFAIVALVKVESGLGAPPPPQTGVSFGGMVAFVEAIAAAFLAYVFGRSSGYIEVPPKPPVGPLQPEELAALTTIRLAKERIVFHPILGRADNGKLADYYVIAAVREGHKGSTPQPELGKYWELEEAQSKTEALNAQLGYGKMKAQRILNRCLR